MTGGRILGRFEKVLLALVGGFAFMGFASTAAPGLQAMVAGVACPAGTTASAVVRYPRVVEATEMVRTTPLVCVVDGEAELASHWRVLPALFAVGLVASIAVIIVVSVLVGLARSGRSDTTPMRPRTAFDGIRFLPLLISMPFVFTTSHGFYWWLAVDTPYRVTGCRSSSGGSATCYDGEPVYRTMSLIFGALAVIGLTVWLVAVVRSRQRTQRFQRAWEAGVRAPATLIGVDSTNTKVNGSTIHRYTYEVRPADGSPPFTFVEKGRWSDPVAGQVGRVVEVIYDPGDRESAFIVPAGTSRPDPAPVIR